MFLSRSSVETRTALPLDTSKSAIAKPAMNKLRVDPVAAGDAFKDVPSAVSADKPSAIANGGNAASAPSRTVKPQDLGRLRS